MKQLMLIILFVIICCINIYSQEIEANVTVNVEQLSFEARNYVSSMKYDVERYINGTRFLDKDWEGPKISVEINIILSGGSSQRYSGKLFVVSKRLLDGPEAGSSVNLRFYDDKWSFNYQQNTSPTYNLYKYDEFSTLLDYYMLLIIGYDLDTYGDMEGSPAFDLANRVVSLGMSQNGAAFATNSKPGDFTKYNLVSELNDMRFYPLRRIFFDYYARGLDKMAFNKDKGILGVDSVITEMYNFKKEKLSSRSVMMQEFFDSKAEEISTIFKLYPDEAIFSKLKYLDAGNSMLYEDAKRGK